MRFEGGRHLGPYEIVAPLGAGGMGELYRARDTRLDRDVNVQVRPAHLTDDHQALARFEQEAAVKPHQANLAPVYAAGAEDGTHRCATEPIDGLPLNVVMRRERMSA